MNQNDAKSFVESFIGETLEHHGIKGQKWGVENGPPYPLSRGVSAAIKRKFKKKTKEEWEEHWAQKKAKREEKKEKRKEKEKQEILKDPSKLYKNRKKFTKEEIDNAMKTFEWEKKLQNYSKDKLETGNKIFQEYFTRAEKGVQAWNFVARLFNSFADRNDDGDFRMPFIMQMPTSKELEEKKKKNKGNAQNDSNKQSKQNDKSSTTESVSNSSKPDKNKNKTKETSDDTGFESMPNSYYLNETETRAMNDRQRQQDRDAQEILNQLMEDKKRKKK